jgi:fructuronate reductase
MLGRRDRDLAIKWPLFDPQSLAPGMLHFGCGAFHRAHQNVFTQQAIECEGGARSGWGVVGVNFRRKAAQRILAPQDHIYTVLERGQSDVHAEVVAVLKDVLFAGEQQQQVIAAFKNPTTKIVTLTITPSGYSACPSAGMESSSMWQGNAPGGGLDAMGSLVAGLAAVRAQGTRPPVLISCDNMPRNGWTLRDALMRRASLSSSSLAAWIGRNVQFPCSVVDRIVPVPTANDSDVAGRLLGLEDSAAVSTEPFRQWVIEDFEGPRPPWELAGAQIVTDSSPWERSKLTLLNGTHMAIAYLGLLSGLDTVASFVLDPLFGKYTSRLMLDEQLPTIPKSEHDLLSYSHQLLERWRNVGIMHQLERVGRNGSEKLRPRLLDSLAQNVGAGRAAPCTMLAVAAWICWAGRLVPFAGAIEDPGSGELQQLVSRANGDTKRLIELLPDLPHIFGEELPRMPEFQRCIRQAVESLRTRGPRGAVSSIMSRAESEATL